MAEKLWILEDLENAVSQLGDALEINADHDLIKAGCIQYFEFCFELAWKAIKITCEQMGLPDCLSPRACLRQAFTQGWITDEASWLEMLDARNRMSHTYNAKRALAIYEELPKFNRTINSLLHTLPNMG